MCVGEHALRWLSQEPSSITLPLCALGQGPSIQPRASQLALDIQSLSPQAGITSEPPPPIYLAFNWGPGDPNLGPHTYIAIT